MLLNLIPLLLGIEVARWWWYLQRWEQSTQVLQMPPTNWSILEPCFPIPSIVPSTMRDYNWDSNHYFPIKLLAGKKMAWFKPAAIEVHHHSKVNSKSLWGIDLSWCGLWTHAVSPQQRWRISVWRGQPLMTGAFRRQSPLKRLIRSQSEPGQSATMQKLSKRVFSRQFCTSAQATSLTVGDGIDHWFGPCFEGTLRCEQILNLNSTTNQSFPVVLYDGFWIDSLLILKAKKKKKALHITVCSCLPHVHLSLIAFAYRLVHSVLIACDLKFNNKSKLPFINGIPIPNITTSP